MRTAKTGQIVYFIETWSENVVKAKVTAIKDEPVPHAELQVLEGAKGNCGREFKDLFESRGAALAFQKQESENLRSKYRAQITDIASLVAFGYNQNVHTCEEYTDWDARAVYAEKALELLGLELD